MGELSQSEREGFGELAKKLQNWALESWLERKEDEADPGDVRGLQNDVGRIARQLGVLENMLLDAMRRHQEEHKCGTGTNELELLREYSAILSTQRSRIDHLEGVLESLQDTVRELHRHLAHT